MMKKIYMSNELLECLNNHGFVSDIEKEIRLAFRGMRDKICNHYSYTRWEELYKKICELEDTCFRAAIGDHITRSTGIPILGEIFDRLVNEGWLDAAQIVSDIVEEHYDKE